MKDIVIMLLFWAMVLAPCMAAMFVCAQRDNEEA
jgi:hypothetical protein